MRDDELLPTTLVATYTYVNPVIAVFLGWLVLPRREPPPDVLLITIDTLRHDAFFGEAEGPAPMPRTAAFAERGAVFDSFYSATNVTQPTHATEPATIAARHSTHVIQRRNMVPTLGVAVARMPSRSAGDRCRSVGAGTTDQVVPAPANISG